MNFLNLYNGKRVFLTGHTGFKGAWMCKVLSMLGAKVFGYSLPLGYDPNLFNLIKGESLLSGSLLADIRDLNKLIKAMQDFRPEIVIHMAAQPLVLESYKDPVFTYSTNVMGTVNILEAIRQVDSVKSFVNVTTDKVYKNNEWCWGYRERDYLDGYDPYSNSKSCSELVTSTYRRSFFQNRRIAVSCCRAGNVIGGGDFAENRIIPDCIRAGIQHKRILVRNPHSIRPYQHVLEPVFAYLTLALKQMEDPKLEGAYNIGPEESDCVSTGDLVQLFCSFWGENISWEDTSDHNLPHEATFLKLDCSKIKSELHWKPTWNIERAVKETVLWAKSFQKNEDLNLVMKSQIQSFLKSQNKV